MKPVDFGSLDEVVAVHLEAFPDFFLSQLGPSFLREYYRCVSEYPRGLLLEERDERGCVGFVAGFLDPASFYREIRRRRLRLGIAASVGLVSSPRRLATLFANYGRAAGSARQPADAATAELSSVGVRVAASGRGIGRRLVGRFVSAAGELGATRVLLTTDAAGNEAVNAFYRGLGFDRVRTFEARRGRVLNEYCYQVGKEASCDNRS
jgi:ribosomal protein S18 acetylase RimI-like enzyme